MQMPENHEQHSNSVFSRACEMLAAPEHDNGKETRKHRHHSGQDPSQCYVRF